MVKKNIMIIANSLQKGGAEKQSLLLTKLLNDKYNVILVVFNNNVCSEYKDLIHENFIKAIFFRGSIVKKIILLIKIIYKFNINIIFSYLPGNTILSGIIGKLTKVPYIIGGYRSSVYAQKYKFLLQKYVHNYINNLTIINNYKGKEFLEKNGYKKSKLLVIPNGIVVKDTPIIRSIRSCITILTVGRFNLQKDFLTSLKAIKLLVNRRELKSINVNFVIAGYGSLQEQIEKWIEELDLTNFVTIKLNPNSIEELYQKADIFLSTSIYEGMPNTIMEAMNYSLPVVCTNVGDCPFLVKENINGYVCEMKDYTAISEQLLRLCLSYETRVQMGKLSYEILVKNFSIEEMSKRYFELIESFN